MRKPAATKTPGPVPAGAALRLCLLVVMAGLLPMPFAPMPSVEAGDADRSAASGAPAAGDAERAAASGAPADDCPGRPCPGAARGLPRAAARPWPGRSWS
jgi:hypothetical protein